MSGVTDGTGSGELQTIVARLDELLKDMAEIRECLFGARKDYFTVHEVAEYAGRAEYTVRAWVKARLIRAERVAGTGPKGRLLIPRGELAKLIASGRGENVINALGADTREAREVGGAVAPCPGHQRQPADESEPVRLPKESGANRAEAKHAASIKETCSTPEFREKR